MPHAILSPSSASRWLACTPSARLEEVIPDKSGMAAAEGTLAHELAEYLIGFKLGRIKKPAYTKKLKEIQANTLYHPDMLIYITDYADYVIGQFDLAKQHH